MNDHKHIIIRKADIDDASGKGYVHYQSWKETYIGLFDQSVLDNHSLDRCVNLAKTHPENTFVALDDGLIVGFSCYADARDEDVSTAGEVMALYVLKSHHGLGIGRGLMDAAVKALRMKAVIIVWVLESNSNAIGFYRHYGFSPDGNKKIVLGRKAIRMTMNLID